VYLHVNKKIDILSTQYRDMMIESQVLLLCPPFWLAPDVTTVAATAGGAFIGTAADRFVVGVGVTVGCCPPAAISASS